MRDFAATYMEHLYIYQVSQPPARFFKIFRSAEQQQLLTQHVGYGHGYTIPPLRG